MNKSKEEIEKEREYNLMLIQLFEEGAVIHDWQVPTEKPESSESGYPEDLRIY
ncbi:hypothetical protein [Pseudomonas caricapapayae]|uniref:hypothetical protein n=1 Tax=Pseudomonas caricapapayae TaxID=46678 RepID=UPI0016801BF6|nr:hypothetical protein [Pseudomonas caricapapayae]